MQNRDNIFWSKGQRWWEKLEHTIPWQGQIDLYTFDLKKNMFLNVNGKWLDIVCTMKSSEWESLHNTLQLNGSRAVLSFGPILEHIIWWGLPENSESNNIRF